MTPISASRIPILPPLCLVLSRLHSDTAAAFRGLRPLEPGGARQADAFIKALKAGNPEEIAAAVFNRFDATVPAALPDLAALRERLGRALSRGPWLSGSGASLWFFGKAGETESRLAEDAEWRRLAKRLDVRIVNARPACFLAHGG